ncbi:hypothetical protein LEMLEM_LOCUS24633, partial [Lemmus lemmus]
EGCPLQLSPVAPAIPTSQVPEQLRLYRPLPRQLLRSFPKEPLVREIPASWTKTLVSTVSALCHTHLQMVARSLARLRRLHKEGGPQFP